MYEPLDLLYKYLHGNWFKISDMLHSVAPTRSCILDDTLNNFRLWLFRLFIDFNWSYWFYIKRANQYYLNFNERINISTYCHIKNINQFKKINILQFTKCTILFISACSTSLICNFSYQQYCDNSTIVAKTFCTMLTCLYIHHTDVLSIFLLLLQIVLK